MLTDDHQLQDASYPMTHVVDGRSSRRRCRRCVRSTAAYWTSTSRIARAASTAGTRPAGIHFRITQPHKRLHRSIGEVHDISPTGESLGVQAWQAGVGEWLPNEDDMRLIASLMQPCHRPGEYAS